MTISTQDLLIAVRRKLIASSEVTALVKDRVHTTHFYDFDNGTIERPAIVIEQVGGSSSGAGNQSSTFYNAPKSSAQSVAVYDAIFQLYAERIEGDVVKGMAQESLVRSLDIIQ